VEHIKFDLGHLDQGTGVRVDLDQQANVRLMDSVNYSAYQAGRQYRFFGGRQVRSPAVLTTPSTGRWYVAIDLGGASGRIHANVSVN
jgi:hypothetical protein